MKFLIVLAAALAVASAGHFAAPVAYAAQHLPVIGPNGVPVDTPAVQHATAAHLAHKVEAHARNGDYAVAPVVAHPIAHPVAHPVAHPAAAVVAAGHGYGYYGQPAAYPTTFTHPSSVNGVPLETPEVVSAKSQHFAAHAEALARTGHVAAPVAPVHHHLYRRSPVYAPYAYGAYGAYSAYPYAAHAYGAYPYYY